MSDTIYALSSGTPPAAIAVVRISGPDADRALQTLTGTLPEPRRATLVRVGRGGEEIDRALVLRFPGPRSATGEDVAELHLHGGRAVVAAVKAALAGLGGLRQAEPGEFTRRAFLNGRIDLAEAEGLADLLAAETEAQRRAALALAGGALSRQVEEWRHRILALSAELEGELDFADEADVGEATAPREFETDAAALAAELDEVLARPSVERIRDGIRVTIAGPPNSGKSSIFNALVRRDAAIISRFAGTTRDLIEAPAAIAGVAFVLTDTAGLRQTEDAVETQGVERAKAAMEAADLVLWLGDPADSPERAVRVHSKCDIIARPLEADISTSAVTGEGIDALCVLLTERAGALLPREGEVSVNARHRTLVAECRDRLRDAGNRDPLIAAEALRLARAALDRVTGRAGVEEMLDGLFARFCIGK